MIKNAVPFNSEASWLESRKGYLTATEMAPILGQNPFSSPQKVLDEKFKPTFKSNAFTIIGQYLEDVVVEASNLTLETKFKVPAGEGKVVCIHPLIRVGATPDAWDDQPISRLLECKSTRPESFIKYYKNAPKNYLVQLATQLLCSDTQEGFLSILSTDLTQRTPDLVLPLVVYKYTRSAELDSIIEQEVTRFWKCYSEDKLFRVDSKVKQKVTSILESNTTKIHSISDENMELYLRNRVQIYEGILSKEFTKNTKSELETLLDGEVIK